MISDFTLKNLRDLITSGKLDIADSFYEKVIFPDLIGTFRENNKHLKKLFQERVSILVLTVGRSWVPIALSILYFRPIYVISIVTSESEEYFRKALSMVEKNRDFTYEYKIIKVDSTDVNSINYMTKRVFFEIYDLFKRTSHSGIENRVSNHAREKVVQVVFDITGGKKTMSIGLAFFAENMKHIAKFADVKVVYIDSIEDNVLRSIGISQPGSERIIIVNTPSPYFLKEIYSTIETMFKSYSYKEIINLINQYINNIVDDIEKESLILIKEIAYAYDNWLKKGQYHLVEKLLQNFCKRSLEDRKHINDLIYGITGIVCDNLEMTKEISRFIRTGKLCSNEAYVASVDLWLRGIRMKRVGNAKEALHLLYQSLVIALSHLLSKKYKSKPRKVDYRKLMKQTGKKVIRNFAVIHKKVFGSEKTPPGQVFLAHELIILLKALESQAVKDVDVKTIRRLTTLLIQFFSFPDNQLIDKTLKWLTITSLNIIRSVGIETGEANRLQTIIRKLTYPLEEPIEL